MSLDEKVLAYAFCNKSTAIKLVDKVPQKLLKEEFVPIFLSVVECVRKYNEIPTLRMLKRCNHWNDELEEKITRIVDIKNNESFEPADFLVDLEDLRTRYKKSSILKMGREIFKKNWNGSEFEDLQEATKSLKRLSVELDRVEINKTYKEGTVSATASEAKELYINRKENPETARGVLTGIRELDRITNGLQPGELMLIGGESGAGKSALAMNIAINAWLGSNRIPEGINTPIDGFSTDGSNVMYFTIEMPFDPFRRRFDACVSEIPLYGVRDGTLNTVEEDKYFSSLRFQELYPKQFHITDIPRHCTIEQVESKYLELMYEFVPELVVVDYISLMKVQSEESDWLNLGRLSELLHEFCRTYNIPCISPVQLNRPKAGSGDSMPNQNRVGRSLMMPQNCNHMLNIQTREDEETRSDLIVNIAKMRDGEKGAFTLYKRFDMMKLYNDPPENWQPELEDNEHV